MPPKTSPQTVVLDATPSQSPSTTSSLSVRLPPAGESNDSSKKRNNAKKPSRRQMPTTHPRLARFRAQSKQKAERDHDAAIAEKRRRGIPVENRGATKRQISNKRSAEICRAAKAIYIDLLEKEIVGEEQKQIEGMQRLLIQTESNTMLRERIRKLEITLAQLTRRASWLSGTPASSNVDAQNSEGCPAFFLTGGAEDDLRQREVEWILDAALEPTAEQLEQVMDFQPSCTTELPDTETMCTDHIPEKMDYATKEHTSPVAIFDTDPEVPIPHSLKPSVHANARTA